MADFVLATNTHWEESPRIRHQVARLLRDAGHRVLFLERPGYPWSSVATAPSLAEPGITVARGTRLLHHQLRVLPALHQIDAWHAGPRLKALVDAWSPSGDFTIVNFMLDGWFLKNVFPERRMVSLVHDDFEAQSRLPMKSHITWAIRRTCSVSDRVLAVSEPLCERLSDWCEPRLFLPWAVVPYRRPKSAVDGRRTLLFWGFIDTGLDLQRIEEASACLAELGNDWRLELVGPSQGRRVRGPIVRRLKTLENVSVHGPRSLDELPLEETLCALLPYRRSGITDAVTLANKSMQLLARGLPLLVCAMPRFLDAPFVIRADGPRGMRQAIADCIDRFDALQEPIASFCALNSPASRLREFES